ncbi:ribosome small subunit-dependent GTPase A [Rhodohalobacter halophilus]|uniref:ribosome small subunit-dependent GTPase A n=1 Tax=Rhodohalobacter halophilus TaxID=1812810 RepID=UPI00083FA1D1|nr:ribosome small subunit-dependent GTPase A [Rhodohalobacter halophilus]
MKKGRIIQSTGKWYKVSCDGEIIDSRLPGKFRLDKKEVTNPVAVGDYVDIEIGNDGTGSIQKIHERENYIPRQATHGRRGEQILVSNVDRAWVVQSVKQPKLNTGFIDRFLVTCEAYEVPGGVIFNKMDLAKSGGRAHVQELSELYQSLGYETAITSAENGDIDDLKSKITGKTSVFIGPSGVGKTSLLNQIEPDLQLRVGEISSYSQKGKHTTTFAQLIPLSGGGYVVDTPGIREFGLVDIDKMELSLYFPEMIEPRQHCKFYNCTHYHEPKCGVVEAFEKGEIAASRYNSYLNILESLER